MIIELIFCCMIYLRKAVLQIIVIRLIIFASFTFAESPDSTQNIDEDDKIIENIYLEIIDVSGPSIQDGKNWQPDIFGKIGNALHLKSRRSVINNILLFKKGELLDIKKINDSERLLRQSGYFYDARILVENAVEKGKVNVHVITKDKWTLNPQLSYNPKNKNGYFGLKDINFLGLGHSAKLLITHDEDSFIGWGGETGYTISNIKGSFVNTSVNIASNHKSNMLQLSLDRSFYTTTTKWAGGLNFTWRHDDLRFVESDNSITFIPNSYDSQDLWVGRSFPLWFGSEDFKSSSSIIFSGRYYRLHYRIRPVVLPDSNRIFENHRLYLFSLGIINRQFYKSIFVNGFGVTEDIPVGGLVTLTTGSDEREYYNRWYYGLKIIYAKNSPNLGYFSGSYEFGGFLHNSNWEQNTIRLDLIYHSPLLYQKDWKGRVFIENNYLLGFKRFDGEQVYLNRTSGMPGFNEFVLPGTKRNVLNLEARIFSPYKVLGFVLGGSVFADYGLIAGANENLIVSRLYQGYGIGFRTQNESISRTKFEIAVVYNPFNPASGKGETSVIFSSSFVLGSRDFNFNEPKTINFTDE